MRLYKIQRGEREDMILKLYFKMKTMTMKLYKQQIAYQNVFVK